METNNNPDHVNKVPFDPGWNDPPKLSYNSLASANKPRNFLNKRVAFPMSGVNSTPGAPSPGNLPPVPCAAPTPIIPMQPPLVPLVSPLGEANINENEIEYNGESALTAVSEILIRILDNSSELGPKSNDIKRRIKVMEDMWTSGKLNKVIQVKMNDLAYALESDQPNKADEIHKALMVDYVSVVGTWMPGVKQLIHHSIAKVELLAIDKE